MKEKEILKQLHVARIVKIFFLSFFSAKTTQKALENQGFLRIKNAPYRAEGCLKT